MPSAAVPTDQAILGRLSARPGHVPVLRLCARELQEEDTPWVASEQAVAVLTRVLADVADEA
ncbi:MAG: hypothetical protein ACRDYU_13905 [Actinomycetes bacterium]